MILCFCFWFDCCRCTHDMTSTLALLNTAINQEGTLTFSDIFRRDLWHCGQSPSWLRTNWMTNAMSSLVPLPTPSTEWQRTGAGCWQWRRSYAISSLFVSRTLGALATAFLLNSMSFMPNHLFSFPTIRILPEHYAFLCLQKVKWGYIRPKCVSCTFPLPTVSH